MDCVHSRGRRTAAALALLVIGAGSVRAIGAQSTTTAPSRASQTSEAAGSRIGPVSGDCGITETNHGLPVGAQARTRVIKGRIWSCIPPYETPAYSKPPDDRVALASLLEASGYSPADNTSWVGVAAGNFCGNAERQLILVQNQSPNFSVLEGPAPRLRYSTGGTSNLISLQSAPWRAVTSGNLDGSGQDVLVAVRKIGSDDVPDLVVAKLAACSCSSPGHVGGNCETPVVVAKTTVGDRVNSDWVGTAVGNFDGTGKEIALLKTAHSNLFLVKMTQPGNRLNVVYTDDLPNDGSHGSDWKTLAAGDIDGDGRDELIVARQESDNKSPTVLVYKWNAQAAAFRLEATSSFGNDGNSNWFGAAAGDFNSDGRQAVVLVKDRHSSFVLMDLPIGAQQLRTLSADDLNSAPGQTWTGITTTDWMSGDDGASELIAVRAVHSPYRTNVFIYGNPFHRVARDTALESTKSQWANWASISDLKNWIRSTHTNTFLWLLDAKGDFSNLVRFLNETKDWGVDGKQLRVWLTLVPPASVTKQDCSQPEATPGLTNWNALDYFQNDFKGNGSSDEKTIAACKDMLAWANVAGRLARDFPHLVGLAIDDFSKYLDQPFRPDMIAAIESNMRIQAAWMNFVPFIYYPQFHNSTWTDLALTLDSMVFFFRNEKRHICIGPGPDCEATVANAPDEIADMSELMPRSRKMLFGIYFLALWSESGANKGKMPSVSYDYSLTRLAFEQPSVGGVVAYGLQTPAIRCDDSNFLQDRFCALQKAYGSDLAIAPATISFPNAFIGEVSTRTVTITNTGASTVTVTVPTSPPPVSATYSWHSGTFVIAPGQAVGILVRFSPKVAGPSHQTIPIAGNALGGPYNIEANGTGLAGRHP